MLSVTYKPFVPSVIMLSVVVLTLEHMLNIFMLVIARQSVVMLIVVAPELSPPTQYPFHLKVENNIADKDGLAPRPLAQRRFIEWQRFYLWAPRHSA
jgi:hypothetical protein